MELIEVQVYAHAAPTVLVDTLNGRIAPTYLEEIRGQGGGSVTISITDPKVSANPELLAYRNILKIKVGGEVVGAMLVGKKQPTIIDSDAAKELTEVAGESLRTWLGDAVVYPGLGLRRQSYKERFFNFASERGIWYKPAEWQNTVNTVGYLQPGSPKGTAPAEWPDAPNAQWIWASSGTSTAAPVGDCYFRYEFTAPTSAKYSFFVSADDTFVIYIDGQKTTVSDPNVVYTWASTVRIDVELDAGPHVFAAKVYNLRGPGGLIVSIFTAGNAALPTAANLIAYTGQAGWKVCPYPAAPPGWTAGEILLTLINEAKARGVRFPNWITPTFTAAADSNGVAWTRELEWSFDVGISLSEVVDKLEELVCDIWIDPLTMKLHAAPVRGVDRTVAGVVNAQGTIITVVPLVFEKGKNLISASIEGVAEIKNTLMIETADGWIESSDVTGSEAKYGRLEGMIETGVSEEVSKAVAASVFSTKADAEEGASYVIVPTPGHVPFKDFGVGDWVLAPNAVGLSVKRRVMSLAVTEDAAGNPVYSVEFDTIFRDNADKMSRWLAKLGGGSLGGLANSGAGGSTFGKPVVSPPAPLAPLVPLAPTALSASSVGSWSTNGVDSISTVTLTWGAVTTNTDGSATVPRFYEVWASRIGDPDSLSMQALVTTNTATVNFVPGTTWDFQVRAGNVAEYPGAFSSRVSHTMVGPNFPMLAPDVPTLTSGSGLLFVNWTGLLEAAVTPPQFRYVYAQVATSVAGTYTRMGATLSRDGRNITIPGLVVGTEYWVKLVAVDGAGISSPASPSASLVVVGTSLADLDPSIQAAIDAALAAGQFAQATADGKNTIYVSTEDPTPPVGLAFSQGDQWWKLGDTPETAGEIVEVLLWNGTIWKTYSIIADSVLVPGSVGNITIADGAISTPKLQAESVTADIIKGGAVQTNHLSPLVGQELDITANGSVTIIAGQIGDVVSDVNDTNDNLATMQTYYKFGPTGAEISTPNSPFSLSLKNDRIEMLENGNVVSYWNSGQMYVSQLVGEKVILGNHQLEKLGTGTVVRAL